MKKLAFAMIAVMVALITGCATGPKPTLRCNYEVGQEDVLTYKSSTSYKTWIEMPKKDPSTPDTRTTTRELVLNRKVTEVAEDGTATMLVSYQKADLGLEIDVRDASNANKKDARKKSSKTYANEGDKFKTDFPGEPKLVGKTFTVKISPSTKVLEVQGLDALLKELKLTEDSEGIVPEFVSEKFIKEMLECNFVTYASDETAANIADYLSKGEDVKTYDKIIQTPNSMIKGQALMNKYSVDSIEAVNNDQLINIGTAVEVLYQPQDGIEEQVPDNFMQKVIKDNSEMNELTVIGDCQFMGLSGRPVKWSYDIDCMLILDGAKVKMGGGDNAKKKKAEPGSEGYMYTKTTITNSCEYKIVK
ncbi:MAG: hypothetical protein JEZ07_01060 [Phycisphaerae bacterium]|nr:hypothetical protein [Phycisphaerae bacterium]